MRDIFELENNKIRITSEILMLKTFRHLYKRKEVPEVEKEFLYIYHFASYRSIGVKKGYIDEELHNFAVTNSGLPDKYFPDKEIVAAIKEYKENIYTAIDEQYAILQRTMRLRNKALKAIALELEVLSDKVSTDKESRKEFFTLDSIISDYVTQIQKDNKLLKEVEKALLEDVNTGGKQFGKLEYTDSLEKEDEFINYERED